MADNQAIARFLNFSAKRQVRKHDLYDSKGHVYASQTSLLRTLKREFFADFVSIIRISANIIGLTMNDRGRKLHISGKVRSRFAPFGDLFFQVVK